MWLEVAVAFGEAVDGFAGGGGFTVELGEEVVLEDHPLSPFNVRCQSGAVGEFLIAGCVAELEERVPGVER